jgi:hypothetical protein
MQSVEKNIAAEVAAENDWTHLGVKSVMVDVPLTDAERIDLGQKQTEALYRLEELEEKLQKIKEEIKDQAAASRYVVKECAKFLRAGTREVLRNLPCFFDPRNNLRVFVDPATGEIVSTTPADPDDRQLKL